MKPLHDRMPVILPIEAWATWLSPSPSKGQLSSLFAPQPNGQLVRTCVSTVVNRPFPDNTECISPVQAPEPLGKESLTVDSARTSSKPRASKKRASTDDGQR